MNTRRSKGQVMCCVQGHIRMNRVVRILGSFEIEDGERSFSLSHSTQMQHVLAYLLLHRERVLVRKHVSFLLWPECDEQRATANLRNMLYRLRKQWPALKQLLQVEKLQIHWDGSLPLVVDAEQFEQGMEKYLALQDSSVEELYVHLEAALAWYRGPLLANVDEEWVRETRKRLERLYLQALKDIVRYASELSLWDKAAVWSQKLLLLEPENEALASQVQSFLYADEQHRAPLRSLSIQRSTIDTEPQPMLTLTSSLQSSELYSNPTPYRGESSLFHIDASESSESLPAMEGDNGFPNFVSPFMGRESLLLSLQQRLLEPRCRWLSLVGMGGTGKTRLAVALGQRLRDRGLAECYYLSVEGQNSWEQVCSFLRSHDADEGEGSGRLGEHRDTVLILDHVNPHDFPRTGLPQLLHQRQRLRCLVVARAPFHSQGEWLFPLYGMSLPEEPTLSCCQTNEAAQYFLSCAVRYQPGFSLSSENCQDIATLCHSVDGLPLGLQFAARWLRTLSCRELVEEIQVNPELLVDTHQMHPPRHRSLLKVVRDVIALLPPEDLSVLSQMTTLPYWFQKEEAQQQAGATLEQLCRWAELQLLAWSPQGSYKLSQLLRLLVEHDSFAS